MIRCRGGRQTETYLRTQKFVHLHSTERRDLKMSGSSVVFVVALILQITGGVLVEEAAGTGEVNPCSDFFLYSCKVRTPARSPMRIKLSDLLDNYLFEAKELSDFEKKIYKFRQRCTHTNLEDKKKFLRKFNPSAGGWPTFNKNWKAHKFDLQAAFAEIHSSDFPTVFMVTVRNEDHYRFRNRLHVKPTIRDKLFNEKIRQVVKRQLSKIIDNADEVIRDSRIVETLFLAEKKSIDFTTDSHVSTDYKGLKQEIPEINWDKQLEVMYGEKVPDSFPVEIYQLDLLKRIIPKIFKLKPKVIANYLFYLLGFFLPDLDENMLTESLEVVAYDMMLKKLYRGETKQKLQGMLVSFIRALANTVNLFGNEDQFNLEKAINEFVMNEIFPDRDDSYFDNTYGKVMVPERDCYSTSEQLFDTSLKELRKIYFKREVDPLYFIRLELKNTLMYHLPLHLDKSSAILFDILIWNSLSNHFSTYCDIGRFKSMQQCLENQIGEKLDEREMKEIVKIQIFTKAYFDWAKDNVNLLQLEETKYNESSKKVLLERLMARYCEYDPDSDYRLRNSTVLQIFANLREVSDVYNCPVGSPSNPQSKCEFIFVTNV